MNRRPNMSRGPRTMSASGRVRGTGRLSDRRAEVTKLASLVDLDRCARERANRNKDPRQLSCRTRSRGSSSRFSGSDRSSSKWLCTDGGIRGLTFSHGEEETLSSRHLVHRVTPWHRRRERPREDDACQALIGLLRPNKGRSPSMGRMLQSPDRRARPFGRTVFRTQTICSSQTLSR